MVLKWKNDEKTKIYFYFATVEQLESIQSSLRKQLELRRKQADLQAKTVDALTEEVTLCDYHKFNSFIFFQER